MYLVAFYTKPPLHQITGIHGIGENRMDHASRPKGVAVRLVGNRHALFQLVDRGAGNTVLVQIETDTPFRCSLE